MSRRTGRELKPFCLLQRLPLLVRALPHKFAILPHHLLNFVDVEPPPEKLASVDNHNCITSARNLPPTSARFNARACSQQIARRPGLPLRSGPPPPPPATPHGFVPTPDAAATAAAWAHGGKMVRAGIHPILNRVTVIMRNGASFQMATTMERTTPYFLREVGIPQERMPRSPTDSQTLHLPLVPWSFSNHALHDMSTRAF